MISRRFCVTLMSLCKHRTCRKTQQVVICLNLFLLLIFVCLSCVYEFEIVEEISRVSQISFCSFADYFYMSISFGQLV